MRVLVTGASGCLGSYLMKTASPGDEVLGTFLSHPIKNGKRMNILNPEDISTVFSEFKPDVVIHCAAESRADFAERKPYQTRQSNIEGVLNILREAKKFKAYVVFISSNAVFDGEYPPYRENDERYPINEYGRIKRDAEDIVFDYQFRSLIIRPIFLYGWVGPGIRRNMDTRIIETLRRGEEMKVATDIQTQPTYALDLANTIWELIKNTREGIFNVSSNIKMSLYDFSQIVADTFELRKDLIKPCKADIFKTLAIRPRDTSYDTKKIADMGLFLRGPLLGLQAMKEEKDGV